MFLFILLSADSLLFGTNSSGLASKTANYFPLFLFVGLCLYCLKNRQKISLSLALGSCLMLILNLFYTWVIVSECEELGSYIMAFYLCVDSFLLTQIIKLDRFISLFEKTVFFLALSSIITYFTFLIIPQMTSLFPLITNKSQLQFSNLLIATFPITEFNPRNFSIFREPGVFSIYLSLSFVFYLFSKEYNVYKFFVYLVCVYTTFSTTAYYVFGIILVMYLFSRRTRFVNFATATLVFAVISLLYFEVITTTTSDDIIYLLNKPFSAYTTSSIVRRASFEVNLEIFLEHFFFGLGPEDAQVIFQSVASSRYDRDVFDNANTFMYFFATYGIVFGSVIIGGFVSFCSRLTNSMYLRLLSIIAVTVLFSSENMYRSFLPYLLTIYGFMFFDKKDPEKPLEQTALE